MYLPSLYPRRLISFFLTSKISVTFLSAKVGYFSFSFSCSFTFLLLIFVRMDFRSTLTFFLLLVESGFFGIFLLVILCYQFPLVKIISEFLSFLIKCAIVLFFNVSIVFQMGRFRKSFSRIVRVFFEISKIFKIFFSLRYFLYLVVSFFFLTFANFFLSPSCLFLVVVDLIVHNIIINNCDIITVSILY